MQAQIVTAMESLDPGEWDALTSPGARPLDPFTTHRFLSALERSGSVGPGTGWQPQHLVLRRGGRLVAAMPLYVKSHSQGAGFHGSPVLAIRRRLERSWRRAGSSPCCISERISVGDTPSALILCRSTRLHSRSTSG